MGCYSTKRTKTAPLDKYLASVTLERICTCMHEVDLPLAVVRGWVAVLTAARFLIKSVGS